MKLTKQNQLMAVFAAIVFFLGGFAIAQEEKKPNKDQSVESTNGQLPPTSEIEERKTMWELVRSGGIMMIPLVLLAVYGFYCGGVQIYVILFSNDGVKDQELLSRLNINGASYEAGIEEVLEKEILKRDRAAFPKMAEAAIKRMYAGKEAVQEVLEEEGALQLGRLKRGIKSLQGVFMVAPLLGLLGTVYGMIASFQSMGTAGDDKVKFLSEGIYEALVTTAAGLTIAIPFLFLYLWLNKKTDEIGENLNRQARSLLSACYPVEGESLLMSGQENARKEADLQESIT